MTGRRISAARPPWFPYLWGSGGPHELSAFPPFLDPPAALVSAWGPEAVAVPWLSARARHWLFSGSGRLGPPRGPVHSCRGQSQGQLLWDGQQFASEALESVPSWEAFLEPRSGSAQLEVVGSWGLGSIQLSLGLTFPTQSAAGCVSLVKSLNLSEPPFL